jgi:hypothetical protein
MPDKIYKLEALYLHSGERLKAYRIAKISIKIIIIYCSRVNLLDVRIISMVETVNMYQILGGIPSGKLRRPKR